MFPLPDDNFYYGRLREVIKNRTAQRMHRPQKTGGLILWVGSTGKTM